MAAAPDRPKDIFLKALDVSPAEQPALVARECGGDAALRQRIEAMLAAHAVADSFLEKPAAALAVTEAPAGEFSSGRATAGDASGTRIGPYKLLEPIGEGAMGVVYMAEQQKPVRRLVAVKIMRPGMDSGQVLARFEAERQALALMDHPNIARVLDAGTTEDGRPYFVMELVKGTRITRFCDERHVPLRERLELFVSVCQAIQHAHQKGIIHRDIKPSNVLIALYDDRPVAKVIDFGLAKATGPVLTDKTLHTGFGAIVGTPEYMSPEQAAFNQLDIDTRSDVYALGVLLYELLTGTTPVDRTHCKEAAILEVLRVVREEEPMPPSVKLSTTEARANIAATRGCEPEKLARALRGELDWIVMKSLEKDRNRRYDSAASLGRDVDRYLHDEMVEARPPSVVYRARRFVRRHTKALLVAGLISVLLIGWEITIIRANYDWMDQFLQASRARVTAEEKEVAALAAQAKARDARRVAEANEREAKAQAHAADTARHALLIEQAARSWQGGDVGETTRFLDRVAPAFTQTWEARYLRELCRRKFRPFPSSRSLMHSAYRGRERWIQPFQWAVASRDGRLIVALEQGGTAADSGTLDILDARTGEKKFTLTPPRDRPIGIDIAAVCISHDGRWLVSVGFRGGQKAGEARVWDLETGRERLALADVPGGVYAVDVSPDDSRIALRCDDTVLIYDARTGKNLQTIPHGGLVRYSRLLFSPDGERLAVYGDPFGPIRILSLKSEKETFNHKVTRPNEISAAAAFSPNGKQLVVSFFPTTAPPWSNPDGTVELLDAETGTPKWTLTKYPATFGVAFSPDGEHLASAGSDQVQILDAATGKLQKSIKTNGPYPSLAVAQGVAYSPDGQHVVVGSGVWNLHDVGTRKYVLHDRRLTGFTSVAFSGDDKRILASESYVWGLVAWPAGGGNPLTLSMKEVSPKGVGARSFSGDGRRIVFRGLDERLHLWSTDTGKEVIALPVKPSGPASVAISHNGRWIASSDGPRITLWDATAGAVKRSFETKALPRAIRPDGKRVACSQDHNPHFMVEIWDTETGKPLLLPPSIPNLSSRVVACLAFSADGKRLAGGTATTWHGRDSNASLIIWDAQTGAVLHNLTGHTGTIQSLVFSPDGKRLASVSEDDTLRLWDVETGQEVLIIKGAGSSVAFSADGKRLAACTGANSVTVWEAP